MGHFKSHEGSRSISYFFPDEFQMVNLVAESDLILLKIS